MTTAAPTPRIEYEDRFRARPDLMRGAEAAMTELDDKLGTNELVPPPSVIRWALRPHDPSSVELSMADEAGGLRATRAFPAAHSAYMPDLDMWVNRVWRALLTERGKVISARLDRRMAEYARSLEANGE